ncbi:FlgD immunoglobulin-like domain containing protein [Rubrivirga marina]|uniref:Uncharacterized protein n=1 Tax=Rubrivirga marina TaxID=1196024 RepID=A0A271J2L8_9BACT|nr:FlgD immunoglobulin-like domain containing protein [Rubrivirga marina]PAP77761.1 hypothetical protein BSZ37_15560 [Rubrivirga marina]
MTARLALVALLGSALLATAAVAQDVPLVYDVEHTGANCPPPPLPGWQQLPEIASLPDPFEWSDGSGRITAFSDWQCRRAEILKEIGYYEAGYKPAPPSDENLDVSYAGGQLTITVTEGTRSLTMTAPVNVPSGDGPFPAVIGVAGPTGSLPSDIFTGRDVATVQFNVGDISGDTHGGSRSGPYYGLYPEGNSYGASVGKMTAWAWGISRIIDAIERTPELNIDPSHLAVTGCSFAGKIALFTGAQDERIALTIAQEPGGGGAAAWRVSAALPYEVESLNRTNGSWFSRTFITLFGGQPETLPYDHHELMALVAPRALLVLNNPSIDWLAAESADVSNAAAKEVWTGLGVPDRFGYSIVGGSHCQLPASQRPQVEAFVDKFLLGDTEADTDVATTPYEADLSEWIPWTTPELAMNVSTGDGPEADTASLRPNRPNPFGGGTAIDYVVREPGPVTLEVFDTLGRRVRTLVHGVRASGEHTATWAGQDDAGQALPAGLYVYRLRIDGVDEARTMVRF